MGRSRLVVPVVTFVLLAASFMDPSGAPRNPHAAGAQSEPTIAFSGLPVPDGVRYSVGLLPPTGLSSWNPRVAVTLPAGADVLQTLETPRRTLFLGSEGGVLTWATRDTRLARQSTRLDSFSPNRSASRLTSV